MTNTPEIQWPTDPAGWCAYWHKLDAKFSTTSDSPLHHDNRCVMHKAAR